MKVLVTGGAGFVGSWCAEEFLKMGHQVLVVDNLEGGYVENIPAGAVSLIEDITDARSMHEIFHAYEPQYVLHAAAFAAENLSNNAMRYTANNICIGTANIVNECVLNGAELLINLSSIACYGHQEPPFTEDIPPMPMDAYGAAKAFGEALCRAAHHSFGLNTITFRPHNILGSRQNLSDKFRNVASIFIRQAIEGKPMTIFSDGGQSRAFSPIRQIAPIICSSIYKPAAWNKVFNIGASKPYTVLELAKMISRIAMVPERFEFLPARKEAVHAYSDHSLVEQYFGKMEEVDLEETLYEMIQEARKNELPPMQKGIPIEIEKNLPEIWK